MPVYVCGYTTKRVNITERKSTHTYEHIGVHACITAANMRNLPVLDTVAASSDPLLELWMLTDSALSAIVASAPMNGSSPERPCRLTLFTPLAYSWLADAPFSDDLLLSTMLGGLVDYFFLQMSTCCWAVMFSYFPVRGTGVIRSSTWPEDFHLPVSSACWSVHNFSGSWLSSQLHPYGTQLRDVGATSIGVFDNLCPGWKNGPRGSRLAYHHHCARPCRRRWPPPSSCVL